MKRIFLVLAFLAAFAPVSFAYRDTVTTATLNTSQLVVRGEAKILSITFVASAASGNYQIYDALAKTSGNTDVKAEGAEATSGNSEFYDFSANPIELNTGLYLQITGGFVIIRYQ